MHIWMCCNWRNGRVGSGWSIGVDDSKRAWSLRVLGWKYRGFLRIDIRDEA